MESSEEREGRQERGKQPRPGGSRRKVLKAMRELVSQCQLLAESPISQEWACIRISAEHGHCWRQPSGKLVFRVRIDGGSERSSRGPSSVFTPYSRRSLRNIHLAPQLSILTCKVEVIKFPILRIVVRSY